VLSKNLHHIRLLRRRPYPSLGRHVQKLEKAFKAPGTNLKSKKTYNGKTRSHLVVRPPPTMTLPSTADRFMRKEQLSDEKAYHIVLRGYGAWVLLVICQHHDVLTPVTVSL